MTMTELEPVLDRHGMAVCDGWSSGTVFEGDFEANKDRIRSQMDLFIPAGAPCIVYGEVVRSIQGDRSWPLLSKPRLSEDEMRTSGRNMTTFGEWCAE